jgi:DNA-binding transcriptional MerR regulator
MADEMTLAELADASGLAARTIRFYIARGLLEGPVKAGRAAAYTAEHLARLEKIKKLQAQGRMLSEIGRSLAGAVPERSAVPPTAWWQHVIADDVVVMTRNDVSPWRTKQIRDAMDELARSLRPTSGDAKRSGK